MPRLSIVHVRSLLAALVVDGQALMARRKRVHRHHSKKQWKWAFANRKPWARRHARRTKKRTNYKRLPNRSRRRR